MPLRDGRHILAHLFLFKKGQIVQLNFLLLDQADI